MRRLGLLITGVLLIMAESAFAQDTSRAEFSVGWRYYHATISSVVDPIGFEPVNDYPKGWYADIAFNLSPMFAIVGDVGGTYQSDERETTSPATPAATSDVKFHTFMGGARVRAPQRAGFVPFGQVLFGGERDTSETEFPLTFSTIRRENSSSSPVLALDAGVSIMAGGIGVRAAGGYVRFFSEADADAFRFSLGGAFRF